MSLHPPTIYGPQPQFPVPGIKELHRMAQVADYWKCYAHMEGPSFYNTSELISIKYKDKILLACPDCFVREVIEDSATLALAMCPLCTLRPGVLKCKKCDDKVCWMCSITSPSGEMICSDCATPVILCAGCPESGQREGENTCTLCGLHFCDDCMGDSRHCTLCAHHLDASTEERKTYGGRGL